MHIYFLWYTALVRDMENWWVLLLFLKQCEKSWVLSIPCKTQPAPGRDKNLFPHQSNQPLKLCTEIFEKASDFKGSCLIMHR